MRNYLPFVFGFAILITVVGYRYLSHRTDPRANDDHPVHIAMGGHDFIVPRNLLEVSTSDDEHLENVSSKKSTQFAQFAVVFSLPGYGPVPDENRHPPFGNQYDDKIVVTLRNQPPEPPKSLQALIADLNDKDIPYVTIPGPNDLIIETNQAVPRAKLTGKEPAPGFRNYFGALYGRELMITCTNVAGFNCHYGFPLGSYSVNVEFSAANLPNWASLYPDVVRRLVGFQKS